MSDKYISQRINPEILSTLDVVAEGKVVSAETWNKLWSLVIQRINTVDSFCTGIQDIIQTWKESEAALSEAVKVLQEQYVALEQNFVHYGSEAPVNPNIRFWIEEVPLNELQRLVTYAEMYKALNEVKKELYTGITKITEDIKNANKSVSNALKGTLNGKVVAIKDISPLPHSVSLKLSSKNLIDNRKIFSSGNIYFGVKNYNQYITLSAGTYTFSVVTADGAGTNVYAIYATDNSNINATYGGTSVSFTLAKETNVKFKAYKDSYTSVDDIISAQVEKGTVATAHTAKIDDFSETKFVLTSTSEVTEPMQEVMLNTPAESVRVVVRGGAYCVGGLVPIVDGDDLTVSNMKDELALWPTWSYTEARGNYDLVYTVLGNTLSWSGTKYYEREGVIEQSKDISGSVELSTSGQKIIGFCQVYSLDKDNPYAEDPERDYLDMTVAIYESTPSVEVKVCGKNLCDFKAFKPYAGGKITLLENGLIYTGRYFVRLDGNILTPNHRYYFNCNFETADNITPVWRLEYSDGTYSSSISNGGGITLTKQVKHILLYPEITGTVHTTTLTEIQIEIGTAASEYEPYIEPATYTVNSDGTVTGVTSVYPSMIFISSADGVEMSVEYNRDLNKAITEIQQVIAQLQTLAVATAPMNEEV